MRAVQTGHQFALFIEQLFMHNAVTINDPILYHRIIRVLKCTIGSAVQLFNTQQHAQAILVNYTKKECFFQLKNIANNISLQPHITLGLPLLKGNDLDEAISFATQVGASTIQLLLTEYSQRVCVFATEQKRLMRVVIAATEQSKRFAMPGINEPIPFKNLKIHYPDCTLLFGMKDGMHMRELLHKNCMQDKNRSFLFVIGPEADFSANEYNQLKEWHAQGISLGPTVLRSCTAAGMGVGLIRALTYSL